MLLHWPTKAPPRAWAAACADRFRRDGYVVLERVFGRDECRRFVGHVGELRAAQQRRPLNPYLHDPVALQFLIDERLHQPLADCLDDEPEAIGTMLVVNGSERLLYQDQCDLPDCMSAWIAMVDINEENGPLVVQPGSHTGRLVARSEPRLEPQPGETRGERRRGSYFSLVREAFRENGRDVLRLMVKQSDVVLFHGRLIHGGAPVRRPGTPRYALACHYIPYHSENWDRDWPRISFDGTRRVLNRNGDASD